MQPINIKYTNSVIRPQIFLWITIITYFLYTCNSPNPTSFDYGTKSDSARYYFHKGWEEIMDNGRWTVSEEAFRKAVELDQDWLLGKSLVGRITRDLEERENISAELEAQKAQVNADERLLLDVNLLSLEAANNRDKGISNTKEFNERRRQLAEKNFGTFARKYPEDSYFKAEYIEFLHYNHGAQTALDSLRSLATPEQMKLGFYISYAASLELELGNLDKAIALYDQLSGRMIDSTYTNPLMLKADIYLAQDSLQLALDLINQVVAIDSNHLIALGKQSQIERLMDAKNP